MLGVTEEGRCMDTFAGAVQNSTETEFSNAAQAQQNNPALYIVSPILLITNAMSNYR